MVIRREASAREIRRKRLIPRTVRESALSAKRCFKSQNGTGPSHVPPRFGFSLPAVFIASSRRSLSVVKPHHATLIRARSVVQVHPGPPFVSVGYGCCPTNLNPQANPHLTGPFAYPLLTPSDIPPAPPVFHRSPPACTDRASSESLRDAECPAQFSVRLSPCSLASCLGCGAG